MKKGFTLIELLVVVLIIGVLSAVALPQYQKAVLKSRTAEAWVNLKNLKMAAEAYCLENPRDYVWFYRPTGTDSSWDCPANSPLSISLSPSKNFAYDIPSTYCGSVNSSGWGATADYNDGSKSFTLGLNHNGYRSCRGDSCQDIGFSKSAAAGSDVCIGGSCGACGASGSCFYVD